MAYISKEPEPKQAPVTLGTDTAELREQVRRDQHLIEFRALATEAALLHEKLMRVGLYRTAQKMHVVVGDIGWEIAEIVEGKHPTKL